RVNPAVQSMFHYTEEEMAGAQVCTLFADGASRHYMESMIGAIREQGQHTHYEHVREVTAVRKDGSEFPAEIQVGQRFVHNRWIIACTVRDVTKKKQDQDLISYMAYHDGL